jgi:peptidoglycan/xylan/chitin deacetylase (PgdA/CDA1 family)
MALPENYLEYPHRRYGMDHDRYEWSMLVDREPVNWPHGNRIALWVNVALQYFPLYQEGTPFAPDGGMVTEYPDLRHYTLREYGNRVGIYRILELCNRHGIRPTFAVSARLAERYPYLLSRLLESGGEIMSHGWHMDAPHFGGQNVDAEASQVTRTLKTLRELSNQPVRGWLSPSRSESMITPDLLAEAGIDYLCDWTNDEMPYRFHTPNGDLVAMPLATELEDRFIIHQLLQSEAAYVRQVKDGFDTVYSEANEQGGRMLSLSIHPWVLGQPHRIRALDEVFDYILGHLGVWSATAGEICDAWSKANLPN